MAVPKEVVSLVERFDYNREAYRSGGYKETRLRLEFIDPFFKALGWDVHNERGYAEPYKDVVHEDSIKVGGGTEAPDYCFQVGGTRKFFVEAKKPSVDIKREIHPAYQLRRYAWSAKLPLSILTDFEEFAVYDCRVRPVTNDKASTARITYLTYADYAEHWEEIASVFSREAILKGSFDKYVESKKRKRGTAEVDSAFLGEIEEWRKDLAKNIALRNPKLSRRELNFAVQRTIDRIIFLRICEDRGVEDYGRLRMLLNGTEVYHRLFKQFREADERYNSGLFHFHKERGRPEAPDELTPDLTIDDKVLKGILKGLYYPDSPYEFSVLPADILGQVYEQFLGKVIRLMPSHRAVIEDKPEVKKAGGVYYTPTYIVDYIVENTVAKLLKDKTPKQASKLRILDPACGSGSFLIGAYQYLLDWHRDWYIKDGTEKHAKGRSPKLYQGRHGDWRLTTDERKRILLKNIYGVDIDLQAVEVTKLSLLLKVLEGVSKDVLERQKRLFHERALPDLASNIKCGNSLIGTDFYEGKQLPLLDDEEEQYRINAFDWEVEYPEIFKRKNPGFDAVIGNPPWGARMLMTEKTYLSRMHPDVADFESSQYFIVHCMQLLQSSGIGGMIVPNTFALNVYARRCREKVLSLACISGIVDLSQVDVFTGPNVRSMILILTRRQSDECHIFGTSSDKPTFEPFRRITQTRLLHSDTWKPLFSKETLLSEFIDHIIRRCPILSEYCQVRQGYIPYRTSTLTRRFGSARAERLVKGRLWHSAKRESSEYQPELQGRDVGRYVLDWSGIWVRYGEWVSTYLPLSTFSGPRILIREITHPLPYALLASYTERIFVHNPSVLAVLPLSESIHMKFLLGILNSRLMSEIFMHVAPKAKKGLFPKIIITDAKRLPVPRVNPSMQRGRALHDKMVQLVEKMLKLHKRLEAAKTAHKKTIIQRQMDGTDRQIDQLVYQLYGLSDEEIRIVEGESSR